MLLPPVLAAVALVSVVRLLLRVRPIHLLLAPAPRPSPPRVPCALALLPPLLLVLAALSPLPAVLRQPLVRPAQRLLVPTPRGLTQFVLLPPLCGASVARLLLVSHLFHQMAAAVPLLRMLLLRAALAQLLVLVSYQQLHVRLLPHRGLLCMLARALLPPRQPRQQSLLAVPVMLSLPSRLRPLQLPLLQRHLLLRQGRFRSPLLLPLWLSLPLRMLPSLPFQQQPRLLLGRPSPPQPQSLPLPRLVPPLAACPPGSSPLRACCPTPRAVSAPSVCVAAPSWTPTRGHTSTRRRAALANAAPRRKALT